MSLLHAWTLQRSDVLQTRKTAVFILSADYSGSTWVGYVLGSSRDSAFLGEYFRAWHDSYAQACTICAARGRTGCEQLHGIESVPVNQAFAWAFERTGKTVLVDSSKVIPWVARALDHAHDHDVRLIHLVRDPRGWLASKRRRNPDASHAAMMPGWLEINNEIREFAGTTAHPCQTVLYEDLADRPANGFRTLFRFCGMTFRRSALAYWNFEHHGFAGNGATGATLPGDVVRERIPHFVPLDEGFYETHRRLQFVDERWRRELPEAELDGILNNDAVQGFMRSIDRPLTRSGVAGLDRSMAGFSPRTLFRAWSTLRTVGG